MRGADPAPAPRDRIGKYEIESELGAGAYGRVFKCYDRELDRRVAVKVLREEVLTPDTRDRYLRDFLNEARSAAKVSHHFVCEIYEVGQDGPRPYIVTRYVGTGTLREWMAANVLPPVPVAVALVRDVALGLGAAHHKGVVHRDVKPANVLWDEESRRVLVTDFGLAKLIDATHTMSVHKGTPLYMSPEQWRPNGPHKVGPPADVYGLGVMLFQMLTGAHPFGGPDDAMALGYAVCHDPRRAPSAVCPRPGIGPELDAVCLKALALEPADRYPSGRAFADALDGCLRAPEPAPVAIPGAAAPAPAVGAAPLEAEAAYQRGEDYYFGRGVGPDHARAREYYATAAALGHADAQNDLGYLYQHARGGPRDYAKAHELFERAAARGNANGQTNLGFLYSEGLGVPQDDVKARALFERAAAQGNTNAQLLLAELCASGRGGAPDVPRAVALYSAAAKQGNEYAKKALKLLELRG